VLYVNVFPKLEYNTPSPLVFRRIPVLYFIAIEPLQKSLEFDLIPFHKIYYNLTDIDFKDLFSYAEFHYNLCHHCLTLTETKI